MAYIVWAYCSKCKKDTKHDYEVTGQNHCTKTCKVCGKKSSR